MDLLFSQHVFVGGSCGLVGSDLVGHFCKEIPTLSLKSISTHGVSLLYLVIILIFHELSSISLSLACISILTLIYHFCRVVCTLSLGGKSF